MPTVAIVAGISAVGSIASAKMGSNAAHTAADTQVASANQARAYQQNATQQAQGLIQQGQAGIQRPPTYNAPGVQYGGARSALSQAMGLGPLTSGPMASQTPYAAPRAPIAVGSGQTPAAAALTPAGSSGPVAGPSAAGLVTMRAPTGETQQVPANQVPRYQAKGAQVVSGGVA